jgi:hypothetical protein
MEEGLNDGGIRGKSQRKDETFENVVTPAKAGVRKVLKRLDTGFRRYDDLPNFRRNSKVSGPGYGKGPGNR